MIDQVLHEIIESGDAIKAIMSSDYASATMRCEVEECNENDGRDYRRKNPEKGWENEPIFLCQKHSYLGLSDAAIPLPTEGENKA